MSTDEPESHVTRLTIDEVRDALPAVLGRVSAPRHRIVVEQHGKPIAAIVPVSDLDRLAEYDREWDEGTEAIRSFSRALASVPADELESEIARIIAEGREGRGASRRPA